MTKTYEKNYNKILRWTQKIIGGAKKYKDDEGTKVLKINKRYSIEINYSFAGGHLIDLTYYILDGDRAIDQCTAVGVIDYGIEKSIKYLLDMYC